MSETKELTYADVSSHSGKKDLYVVVHDKVYNATTFIDEHPGGEEVLLDVGGQDATEAFEDVGHSDEAREILEGLLVGDLKRMVRLQNRLNLSDSTPHPIPIPSAKAPLLAHHLSTASADKTLSQPGDPAPHQSTTSTSTSTAPKTEGAGMGVGLYALVLLGGLAAFGAYKYLQMNSEGKK